MNKHKKIAVIISLIVLAVAITVSACFSFGLINYLSGNHDSGSDGLQTSQAAGTDYSQFRTDDIAHGWSGSCPWSISKDGVLTLWEGTPEPVTTSYIVGYDNPTATIKAQCEQTPIVKNGWWNYTPSNTDNSWRKYRTSVKSAVVKSSVIITNAFCMFAGLNKMESIELPNDMSQCSSLASMFDGCWSLTSADLKGRNISNVKDMRYMFRNCEALEWCYLNDIDTQNVTNMRYMFQACVSLINVDLSNFRTDNLKETSGLFTECWALKSVDLSSFKIPSGTDNQVGYMFSSCRSIQRIKFGNNKLSTNDQRLNPTIPTTTPYTGKWVNENNSSIVLTTAQLVSNYPNTAAPVGTYVWQTTSAVISFDGNGGTTTESNIVQNGTSSVITLPRSLKTSRSGYQLVSWNTERNGSGTHYYLGQHVTPQQGRNLTLYAQWKSNDSFPDKLVNGDFEYGVPNNLFSTTANSLGAIANSVGIDEWEKFTVQVNGGCDDTTRKSLPDADPAKFGWKVFSDRLDSGTYDTIPNFKSHASLILWLESNKNKVLQVDKTLGAVYQDIKTKPTTIYKWQLDSAGQSVSVNGITNVLIGKPDQQTAQNGYRTKINGNGDTLGYVGTALKTTTTNPTNNVSNHVNQFETYSGFYIIPENQSITRIAIDGADTNRTIVDNISFKEAYLLSYNMNDDTAPATEKANRNGIYADAQAIENNYQGYYTEDDKNIQLTTAIPTRPGYKFVGWSLSPLDTLEASTTTEDIQDQLITSITDYTQATTVYAVWKEAAKVIYDIDNGTSTDANINNGVECSIGDNITLSIVKPTREGYKFLGWSKTKLTPFDYMADLAANNFVSSAQNIKTVNVDEKLVKIYAVWQDLYSRKIVNGGFEYPGKSSPFYYELAAGESPWNRGTIVCPYGTIYQPVKRTSAKTTIPNWNAKIFGWKSPSTSYYSQYAQATMPAGIVAIDYDGKTSNSVVNTQIGNATTGVVAGGSIYQDILTTPGAMYKWTLKHALNDSRLVNGLSVMIGTQANQVAQDAYRLTANKYGSDKIGYAGKEFYTAVNTGRDNWSRWWGDEWENYTGTYIVPANQNVTRFTFKNLNTIDKELGSRIDDIAFSVAYKLNLNKNTSDTTTLPSGSKVYNLPTDNNNSGFFSEGDEIKISEYILNRTNYKQIGWSTEPMDDLTKDDVIDNEQEGFYDLDEIYTMKNKETTLYAVWQENIAPLNYIINGYDNLNRNGIYEDAEANNQQGYYTIGSTINLTTIKPTRIGHNFIGWSTNQINDIAYLDDATVNKLNNDLTLGKVSSVVMPKDGINVYAVWQEKYSRKILNGDFEYPSTMFVGGTTRHRWFSAIEPATGKYAYWEGGSEYGGVHQAANYNPKMFGWLGSQETGMIGLAPKSIEIQYSIVENTRYGELAPSQSYQWMYQDILTQPNAIYKWSLKHSGRAKEGAEKMIVEIGQYNGTLNRQPAWRTKANEYSTTGQMPNGEISTILRGTVNDAGTPKKWETFEGTYLVPENQYVSRFQFREISPTCGNHLDDIAFSIAYPLNFNVNGGINKTIYTDATSNNYIGYHPEGENVSLPKTDNDLTAPSGYRMIGWSLKQYDLIDENTSDEIKQDVIDNLITDYNFTMPAQETTLYAVYAKDVNVITRIIGLGRGGKIELNSSDTSKPLYDYSYLITPDEGWRIDSIRIDGVDVVIDTSFNQDETYTVNFINTSGEHLIETSFVNMNIQVPLTGQQGIGLGILCGGIIIGIVITRRIIRERKFTRRKEEIETLFRR